MRQASTHFQLATSSYCCRLCYEQLHKLCSEQLKTQPKAYDASNLGQVVTRFWHNGYRRQLSKTIRWDRQIFIVLKRYSGLSQAITAQKKIGHTNCKSFLGLLAQLLWNSNSDFYRQQNRVCQNVFCDHVSNNIGKVSYRYRIASANKRPSRETHQNHLNLPLNLRSEKAIQVVQLSPAIDVRKQHADKFLHKANISLPRT